MLLFGAGRAGLTGILPKTAAPDTLAGLIEAACPPQAAGPVLVVDDDAESRAALERLVRESSPGLRVRTAADGLAALRAMEEERPSLVLLDVVMPGLDGLSVLDRMRATSATRDVPVIVLTNRMLSAEDVKRIEGHTRVLLQAKGVWSDGETAAAVNRSIFGTDELPAPTGALVKRAVAWLAANHARPVARWQLAEAVGASEDYLSRIFRRELGLSPWEYLNRYRVHRAGELLQSSGEGVKAIAARVGFQDPAYFSRVFRRITGSKPARRSKPSETVLPANVGFVQK
jgi:AraC-like DNA-binding protein